MSMGGEQAYTVYATRCADGAVERHSLTKRTVWQASLWDIERFDKKDCGPHTLLSAEVHRTPWEVAVEPAQSVSSADVVKTGALEFCCPRCGVDAGSPCENLIYRRKGIATVTSWPHPERIALCGRL